MKFDRKGMTKKMLALLVALLAATMIIGSLGVTAQQASDNKPCSGILPSFCSGVGDDQATLIPVRENAVPHLLEQGWSFVNNDGVFSCMEKCVGQSSTQTLEAEAAGSDGPSIQCVRGDQTGKLITGGSNIHSAIIDLSVGCPLGDIEVGTPGDCVKNGGRIQKCA